MKQQVFSYDDFLVPVPQHYVLFWVILLLLFYKGTKYLRTSLDVMLKERVNKMSS